MYCCRRHQRLRGRHVTFIATVEQTKLHELEVIKWIITHTVLETSVCGITADILYYVIRGILLASSLRKSAENKSLCPQPQAVVLVTSSLLLDNTANSATLFSICKLLFGFAKTIVQSYYFSLPFAVPPQARFTIPSCF